MLRYTLFVVTTFLFIASLFAVNGYRLPGTAAPEAQAKPEDMVSCVGVKVFDGDTFGCDMDGNGKIGGKREYVRMLGIDSSEMYYSRKNRTGKNQPYALEATQFVEKAVLNKTVYLEYDRQQWDKYNRQLAYVYLDRTQHQMLNEMLLDEGLAKILFLGVNRRYQPQMEQAELAAQQARKGLWR